VIPLSSLEATAPVIAPDCNAPSREIEGLSGRNSNESRESLPGSTLIEGMVASASCFDVAGFRACAAPRRRLWVDARRAQQLVGRVAAHRDQVRYLRRLDAEFSRTSAGSMHAISPRGAGTGSWGRGQRAERYRCRRSAPARCQEIIGLVARRLALANSQAATKSGCMLQQRVVERAGALTGGVPSDGHLPPGTAATRDASRQSRLRLG
jgi:hypothetical protein